MATPIFIGGFDQKDRVRARSSQNWRSSSGFGWIWISRPSLAVGCARVCAPLVLFVVQSGDHLERGDSGSVSCLLTWDGWYSEERETPRVSWSPCGGTAVMGSVTVKVLPCPGTLASSIVPPKSVVNCLTMESPSPVPLTCRVEWPSTW